MFFVTVQSYVNCLHPLSVMLWFNLYAKLTPFSNAHPIPQLLSMKISQIKNSQRKQKWQKFAQFFVFFKIK